MKLAMRPPSSSTLTFAAVFAVASCGKTAGGPAPSPVPADGLRDEAGFIDVPPQAGGAPYRARMFYVFEAADDAPASRPLAVFMAGGPGYPTSLELLPYGTARGSGHFVALAEAQRRRCTMTSPRG